jgi:hypothetical protein
MLQICQIDYLSSTKNILDFKVEVTWGLFERAAGSSSWILALAS